MERERGRMSRKKWRPIRGFLGRSKYKDHLNDDASPETLKRVDTNKFSRLECDSAADPTVTTDGFESSPSSPGPSGASYISDGGYFQLDVDGVELTFARSGVDDDRGAEYEPTKEQQKLVNGEMKSTSLSYRKDTIESNFSPPAKETTELREPTILSRLGAASREPKSQDSLAKNCADSATWVSHGALVNNLPVREVCFSAGASDALSVSTTSLSSGGRRGRDPDASTVKLRDAIFASFGDFPDREEHSDPGLDILVDDDNSSNNQLNPTCIPSARSTEFSSRSPGWAGTTSFSPLEELDLGNWDEKESDDEDVIMKPSPLERKTKSMPHTFECDGDGFPLRTRWKTQQGSSGFDTEAFFTGSSSHQKKQKELCEPLKKDSPKARSNKEHFSSRSEDSHKLQRVDPSLHINIIQAEERRSESPLFDGLEDSDEEDNIVSQAFDHHLKLPPPPPPDSTPPRFRVKQADMHVVSLADSHSFELTCNQSDDSSENESLSPTITTIEDVEPSFFCGSPLFEKLADRTFEHRRRRKVDGPRDPGTEEAEPRSATSLIRSLGSNLAEQAGAIAKGGSGAVKKFMAKEF